MQDGDDSGGGLSLTPPLSQRPPLSMSSVIRHRANIADRPTIATATTMLSTVLWVDGTTTIFVLYRAADAGGGAVVGHWDGGRGGVCRDGVFFVRTLLLSRLRVIFLREE